MVSGIIKDQNLSAGCAHCYWSVFVLGLLSSQIRRPTQVSMHTHTCKDPYMPVYTHAHIHKHTSLYAYSSSSGSMQSYSPTACFPLSMSSGHSCFHWECTGFNISTYSILLHIESRFRIASSTDTVGHKPKKHISLKFSLDSSASQS